MNVKPFAYYSPETDSFSKTKPEGRAWALWRDASTECCTYDCDQGRGCPVRQTPVFDYDPKEEPSSLFSEMFVDLMTIILACGLIVWGITSVMGVL